MMTDSSGSSTNRYEYEPYGSIETQNVPLTNPFKFAGGHDTGQGVYHFGARQYDPALGRWTQADPLDQISDLTQAKRYMYVGGNPINATDPTGEQICPRDTKGLGGTPGMSCYGGSGRPPFAYQRGGCGGVNFPFRRSVDAVCIYKSIKDVASWKKPMTKAGAVGAGVCAVLYLVARRA